jgi:hypothetical protein
MKKLNVASIVVMIATAVMMLATSCAVSVDESMESGSQLPESITAAANDYVQLLESEIVVTSHPAPYTMTTTLIGEIKIKNIAFEKNVIVHIDTVGAPLIEGATSSGWFDVAAEYSHAIDDQYEIWTFSVPTSLYKGGMGSYPIFEYVIRYDVNGTSYWDNNSGNNYWNEFVLLSEVNLKDADYYTSESETAGMTNHHLEGTVEVRNMGYEKNVDIMYLSVDGTWKESSCNYTGPSTNGGNEYWAFSIVESAGDDAAQGFYQFAIRYQVNGEEYWDNNQGQDYSADSF